MDFSKSILARLANQAQQHMEQIVSNLNFS